MAIPEPQQIKIWLDGAARQDRQAFRSLYEATSPKLFGFALRILNKRELAEEALQESFISIWNGAAGYQSSLSSPMTWMTTIVRNKALDLLRRIDQSLQIDGDSFKEGAMQEILDNIETVSRSPGEAYQMSENAKELAKCLARLEGLHRQAIAMAFYHDLSHKEVADQMKLPIGTVKSWIRRGLERLKLCLSKLEGA